MTLNIIYLLCMVVIVYAAPQRQEFTVPDQQSTPYDLMGSDDLFSDNDLTDDNNNPEESDSLNEISNSQNLNSFYSRNAEDKETKKETYEKVLISGELFENETAAVLNDPCYAVSCDDGAMCVVTNQKTKQTSCYCPTICQNEWKPVCSVHGKQYNSKCDLHKEACKARKNIIVAYEGSCIAKQGPCLDKEMIQFPIRFLGWMMHLRQEEKAGRIDKNSKLVDLTPNEKSTVAEWMFHHLDLEKDLTLQQIDLRDILLYLLPVEHCVDEFLTSCDTDENEELSMNEWKTCLLPGSNTVEDTFFDDVNSVKK